MDTKEKHIKENEAHHNEDVNSDLIAESMKAKGKNEQRESTRRINKLWLWLGVLVLIAILIWWLFTYVIAFDVAGDENSMLLRAIDSMKMLC